MTRPDDHDIAHAVCDQLDPTQEEGPHENVAEFAVGLHETQQLGTIQRDHLARLRHSHPDQRGAARKRVDLSGELPGAVDREKRLASAGGAEDL